MILADKRKFSNDEFDDIDLTEEEREYLYNSSEESEELEEDDEETTSDIQEKKEPRKTGLAVAIIGIIVVLCVVMGIIIVRKTPTKKRVNLYDYYDIEKDADLAAIVHANELTEYKAIIENDGYYFPLSYVNDKISDKFYYDAKNNWIIYTTPTKIYQFVLDYDKYYVDEEVVDFGKKIIIERGDESYILCSIITELTGNYFVTGTEPDRIATCVPNTSYELVTMKSSGIIRTGTTIKHKIIGTAKEEIKWYLSEEEATKGWKAVVSEDGRKGFVKEDSILSIETVSTDEFKAEEYTNQLRDHKIVLVWDGIYVTDENAKIGKRLEKVTNVNVISPTWYELVDAEGNISSKADQEYVDYVHSLGLEIWPLISDFNSVSTENGFSEADLLSDTTTRRILINAIMTEIKTYGYDGINIDFEKIKADFGKDFVQFIRELSIECRKAEVVLSVDNYPPYNFNAHYGREAQGECIDYFIVMCYDEHYDGGEAAGSTASIEYVTKGMDNSLLCVDKEKLIVGVPFYSRLWTIDPMNHWEEGNETKGTILGTKAYSMTGGLSIAKEYGLTITWNNELKQYVAAGGYKDYYYQIWLETCDSMSARVDEIAKRNPAGVACWVLTNEDSDVWGIFSKIKNTK